MRVDTEDIPKIESRQRGSDSAVTSRATASIVKQLSFEYYLRLREYEAQVLVEQPGIGAGGTGAYAQGGDSPIGGSALGLCHELTADSVPPERFGHDEPAQFREGLASQAGRAEHVDPPHHRTGGVFRILVPASAPRSR